MNRIPRKVAARIITVIFPAVLALFAGHHFAYAQNGYIGEDEIVIDGVAYKRTETEFQKISPLPEETTTSFYNGDVYSDYLQQDPYPSLDGQMVSPTVICEDTSLSKCTSIGTAQAVAIGDTVYGDFYQQTALWQKVTYKGVDYYSPYDVLNPGRVQIESENQDKLITPAHKEATNNNVVTKNNNKKPDTPNPITIQEISKALDSAVKKTGEWVFTKTIEYNRNRGTWIATPEQGIGQIAKDMNDFYGTNYTTGQIAKINGVSDVNQIKTGSTFVIGTPDGWQPPKKTSNIDEEYWNKLTQEQQQIMITHKNFYQGNLPDSMDQLNRNEWTQPIKSIAHNIGTSGNVELRGKGAKIGHQAIYGPDGKRVDSPENMGTFDLIPPKLGNYMAHLRVDVKPWLNFGNSPADTTTYSQRVDAMSKTRSGRTALVYFSFLKLIEK